MKYIVLFLLQLVLFSTSYAQNRSFLIDFGPNDIENGNITLSPDLNGNYWNNVTDPTTSGAPVSLVDKTNEASDIEVSIVSDFLTNGILNGGLLAPEEVLLGELAIATATQDYFFTVSTGTIAFDNLDPSKAYVFNLFSSRNINIVRWSKFLITGANQVVDSLQSSGPNLGGEGYNGNNSTILSTTAVRPDASGRITINISILGGVFAYLNMMRIDEVEANPQYFVDFGPNDIETGNVTLSPDTNGIYWNNMTMPSINDDTLLLVDKGNNLSNIYLKVAQSFLMNGIQNGGLLMPEDSLLGNFAIPTATQDYFFTTDAASLEIGGLDTSSNYVFSFFGSRNTTINRITNYSLSGENSYSGTLQTSGAGIGAGGYNGNNNTILVSDTITPDAGGKIVLDMSVVEGGFAYLGCMMLEEIQEVMEPEPLCPEQDSLLIAVMGASVALGVGANITDGYAYQYAALLEERAMTGQGADWEVVNISIGGNNTVDVLDRWETDLRPLCSRYVIYGLSLGNEGITNQGQAAFDQFRDNMLILISQAREYGIEPIVMNCYARSDYNATDYDFIKQMNLQIHEWDVASVNTLGAIDNGAGQWAPGYFADPFHPNTEGHLEFSYAMVPSLFDALDDGKPQPQKVDDTYLTIDKTASDYQLEFRPDHIVHPFTFSFELRTSGTGDVAGFITEENGYGGLIIGQESGVLDYITSDSDGIQGETVVNDGAWHHVVLTHYYAWGKTFLYIDGMLQGEVDEKLEPQTFILSEQDAPTADYSQWLFYRSAMTPDEVNSIVDGALLKSSLELYAPLDGQGDTLVNLAQSINTIEQVDDYGYITGTSEAEWKNAVEFQLFPNPSFEEIEVTFQLRNRSDVRLSFYDAKGRQLEVPINEALPPGAYHIKWKNPKAIEGMYFCVLSIDGVNTVKKFFSIEE